MFCKNCGNELSNGSVFCNKCGTKIEEKIEKYETIPNISEEQHPTIDNTNTKPVAVNNKKKIIVIAAVVLVVVIVIVALFGGGNDYQGSGNAPAHTEDSFGANNQIVTQPPVTEPITAASVDVDVVVNRTNFYSPLNGTLELVEYQVSNSVGSGVVLEVKIKVVDKINDSSMWDSFNLPCAVYDAQGTLLYANNARGEGWKFANEGDILKATFHTFQNKDAVAKIEIG